MSTPKGIKAWLILANGEPDQVTYSQRETAREVHDLRAMGCEDVRCIPCRSGDEAEDLGDSIKYGDKSAAWYIREHNKRMIAEGV